MRPSMRRLLLAPLAALLATGATGGALHAQVLGGSLLSATISQSLAADSNFELDDPSPGASYFADTRLVLGLLNETQTQVFALGLDTGLRALWEAEEDFEFTFASPSTATLDYGREWAAGSIDTFLRYRQRDVDSTRLVDADPGDPADPDSPTPTPDDLREISGDATERRYDAGVGLEFATDSPSSYALNLSGTRFDYSGDTGGDGDTGTPRTTVAGDATWRLQLNPVFAGTLGAGYSRYEAEDEEETRIREGVVDAGVIYDPSEVLEVSLGLGYATYTREELDGDGQRQTIDDDSGYVLRAGARYLFEDVTLTASTSLTNAAPQTRLSGDVRARYPLPNGALTGRVFQRYGGGAGGDEIRVTGGSIGLDHEINTISRLGFDVAVVRQESLDVDEPDLDRLNFTATYSYDITEAVSASVGYAFRRRDEDPERATSNAVFFEIGRTFETRF